jgi:hypothetical protein
MPLAACGRKRASASAFHWRLLRIIQTPQRQQQHRGSIHNAQIRRNINGNLSPLKKMCASAAAALHKCKFTFILPFIQRLSVYAAIAYRVDGAFRDSIESSKLRLQINSTLNNVAEEQGFENEEKEGIR